MLLHLLFVVAALGDSCETSTCGVCKNISGCDWFGYDCLNSTSSIVTTLKISNQTCEQCQAGSCGECTSQSNCSWYSSRIFGISGKCAVSNTTFDLYTAVDKCPTCQMYDADCKTCGAHQDEGCGWFVLPGNVGGKCREAPPAFAYTKVANDSCDTGNRCSGIESCITCQNTNSTSNPNASSCVWYTSKQSAFYDSKCDNKANVVESKLYDAVNGQCPACAGTSCVDCKAEAGCKWVAAKLGLGTAFGECLKSDAPEPTGKDELTTCPAQCDVRSCDSCVKSSACAWFTGSDAVRDTCDLASDAIQHPFQKPIPSPNMQTCQPCQANRCYECNNLANCGWYVEYVGPVPIRQGCFETSKAPSDRKLRPNSDSKCDGKPNSSAQVAASMALLVVLALLA